MASKKTLIMLAVFAVLILGSMANAQIVGEIRLNISASGSVLVSEDFLVSSQEEKMSLYIPPYNSLEITSSGLNVSYLEEDIENGKKINMDFSSLPSDVNIRDVLVKYETQYMTSKNGSVWSASFSTKATPRKTIIKIHFPTNSTILSLNPRDVFFSVDRDSLWLYPQDEQFNFTCSYEHAGNGISPPFVYEDNTIIYVSLIVLIVLFLLVGGVVYYLLRKRASSKVVGKLEMPKDEITAIEPGVDAGEKKPSNIGGIEFEFKTGALPTQIKSTVFNILDDSEKSILSLIQNNSPEDITQAFIYKTTKMPKSSLSEIIKRLEKRNVIECRREGRVNWIKLKKWVLE